MSRRLPAWPGLCSIICSRGLTAAATSVLRIHQSVRSLRACHPRCNLFCSLRAPVHGHHDGRFGHFLHAPWFDSDEVRRFLAVKYIDGASIQTGPLPSGYFAIFEVAEALSFLP